MFVAQWHECKCVLFCTSYVALSAAMAEHMCYSSNIGGWLIRIASLILTDGPEMVQNLHVVCVVVRLGTGQSGVSAKLVLV